MTKNIKPSRGQTYKDRYEEKLEEAEKAFNTYLDNYRQGDFDLYQAMASLHAIKFELENAIEILGIVSSKALDQVVAP